MQHKFHKQSSPYSTSNQSNATQKSPIFKSKPIFKQSKRIQDYTQISSWSRHERRVFVRLLLRVVSRDLIVQTSLYQNVSRFLQKSPKNVYNFHLKLLSQYRTNENIIAAALGEYFVTKKQAKLQNTLSCNNYQLNLPKLDLEVSAEVNSIFDTLLSTELNFIQTICLVDKTPEEDFDSLYKIQIFEYEMEGIQSSDMTIFENTRIECQ